MEKGLEHFRFQSFFSCRFHVAHSFAVGCVPRVTGRIRRSQILDAHVSIRMNGAQRRASLYAQIYVLLTGHVSSWRVPLPLSRRIIVVCHPLSFMQMRTPTPSIRVSYSLLAMSRAPLYCSRQRETRIDVWVKKLVEAIHGCHRSLCRDRLDCLTDGFEYFL